MVEFWILISRVDDSSGFSGERREFRCGNRAIAECREACEARR